MFRRRPPLPVPARLIKRLPMAVIDLANPARFLTLVNRVLPWLAAATVLLFAFGLYRVMGAPDDYQQGATVKIMFLHVPAAWLGMMGWGVMTVAALGTLVWRHPLADVAGKAAAPIGAAFTFICLVTGSLWGRPMWGTYWVWDARLTSALVVVALVGWIAADYKAQRRVLADLEQRGVTRRSQRTGGDAARDSARDA